MKVLVLGASGIVGQHMRLCVPPEVEPVWVRQTEDPITRGCDLRNYGAMLDLLADVKPEVTVNLAGESSVDLVERNRQTAGLMNCIVPSRLAHWSENHHVRLIQISSQAVHSGARPPYVAFNLSTMELEPVNEYGRQKKTAELLVLSRGGTVIRLTFILGIRPMPHVGRLNPLEDMLARPEAKQVCNRSFSPLMAWDAATAIWNEITNPSGQSIVQVGIPQALSRFQIARMLNPNVQPCNHEDFPGLAQRAFNTMYSKVPWLKLPDALTEAMLREEIQMSETNDRAIELSLFFGITAEAAMAKLAIGFGQLHNEVTADFRAYDPQGDEGLLNWYRTTESYIWELSAYHEDPGFNYAGMCKGIAERLLSEPERGGQVLCLGDGIGDLTLTLKQSGIDAYYHDLAGSRTAEYARFRFWRKMGYYFDTDLSKDFGFLEDSFVCEPDFYSAVVSLDFLEHVPNVEEWVRAIHKVLMKGGLFCAQNAFACGSGPDGSIPMHLAVNDRFERDWDPLLAEVGFEQLSSNWYRKVR